MKKENNTEELPISIGEEDEWTQPFPKKLNEFIPINKETKFGFCTGYIPYKEDDSE